MHDGELAHPPDDVFLLVHQLHLVDADHDLFVVLHELFLQHDEQQHHDDYEHDHYEHHHAELEHHRLDLEQRRDGARNHQRGLATVNGTALIAGRYQLESRLGVGGMSTVHLAFDQRLERYVAIKLLAEHLADDPTFISRFRREALSAARLVHPNIVQVLDFGFDEHQHQHFIVMEHVRGHSCAELLRDRGHLDIDPAVDIITQACRGLDYAHRHGVVHRDVKPGNLLVSDAGVVKLADFGIARATDQSSITQVGSVLGTAAYLAPEQARGEEATPKADIYSLGVVSYQLLSGRLPYEATSLSELALKQQRESPVPLDQLNPRVGRELARAVAMALCIDPQGRPADASLLADVIRMGADGIPPRPDTAATAHLGSRARTTLLPEQDDPTGATRVVPRRTPPLSSRGVPSRPIRQAPRRAPASRQAAVSPSRAPAGRAARGAPPTVAAERRRRVGARRFAALVSMLLVLIVVVAGGLLIANQSSSAVRHLQRVVSNDFNTAVKQLQNLIDKNTK
jgi:eukaryotic-like serine/threonine-protein kinase